MFIIVDAVLPINVLLLLLIKSTFAKIVGITLQYYLEYKYWRIYFIGRYLCLRSIYMASFARDG